MFGWAALVGALEAAGNSPTYLGASVAVTCDMGSAKAARTRLKATPVTATADPTKKQNSNDLPIERLRSCRSPDAGLRMIARRSA